MPGDQALVPFCLNIKQKLRQQQLPTTEGCNDSSKDGSNECEHEPLRHVLLQPALWQGGAWQDSPPPNDGPGRGIAKPFQYCRL